MGGVRPVLTLWLFLLPACRAPGPCRADDRTLLLCHFDGEPVALRRRTGVEAVEGRSGKGIRVAREGTSLSYPVSVDARQGTVELWVQRTGSGRGREYLFTQPGYRDLDGDGFPDLVVGNFPVLGSGYHAAATSTIFHGTAVRGEFHAQPLPTEGARGISAGDLDGDGSLDLVVSNAHGSSSRVYYGPGFVEGLELPSRGAQGSAIVDFDADGTLDVLLGAFQGGGGPSEIHFGAGGGVRAFPRRTPVPLAEKVECIDVADLDRDGVADVLFSCLSRRGALLTLGERCEEGWCTTRGHVLPGEGTLGALLCDLDGDGEQDVVLAEPKNATVRLCFGPPPFEDTQEIRHAEGSEPFTVAAADLDQDGFQDVLVCARFAGSVEVLWGRGRREFERDATALPACGPRSAVVGDLDRDGWPDVVVHNGDVVRGEEGSLVQVYYSTGGTRRFDGPYELPCLASRLGLGTTLVGSIHPAADNAYGAQPCRYNTFELYLDGNEAVFEVWDHAGLPHRVAAAFPGDGGFHHVAASWGPSGMRLRVDGTLRAEGPVVGVRPLLLPYVTVATDRENQQTFRGTLDELHVSGVERACAGG